ncbi:unnamed protein product, partial [Symbiodinium sp. CCMP2456]
DKKQDERAKAGKRITAAKEWNLPTKAMVRAFPDESGCMLKTGGKSVKKALAPGQLRDRLDSDSSELIRRPGMGLNLAAASISAGLEVLNLGEDMGPALINKQKAWSRMVPEVEKQAPGIRRWVAEPSDESLCEGLAQSLKSLFYWGGTKEKRRFGAEDADSEASSGGMKKPRFGGPFLAKVKTSRRKASTSTGKSSASEKKKKHGKHGKKGKDRRSDSSTSSRPGFGLLRKKTPDEPRHKKPKK